jgi:hypothetical protein
MYASYMQNRIRNEETAVKFMITGYSVSTFCKNVHGVFQIAAPLSSYCHSLEFNMLYLGIKTAVFLETVTFMPCILRVGEIVIPKRPSRAIIYKSRSQENMYSLTRCDHKNFVAKFKGFYVKRNRRLYTCFTISQW